MTPERCDDSRLGAVPSKQMRWLARLGVAIVIGGAATAAALTWALGSGSAGSHSVQVGAFAFTVPRGFCQESSPCPIRHCRLRDSATRVRLSNRPFTAAGRPIVFYRANRVVLDFSYLRPAGALPALRLPLNLDKLQSLTHPSFGRGTLWGGYVAGGGTLYQVYIFEGSNASAADRASVLQALGSIHRVRCSGAC